MISSRINEVIVYTGHYGGGPYAENVRKQIDMFKNLNWYRAEKGQLAWTVSAVAGEALAQTLHRCFSEETLLVIPAGQSTHLDEVFSDQQNASIKTFLERGGRGYFTCGSAYWVSQQREYEEESHVTVKKSRLPLFEGHAKGPLCPFPGGKYRVGFLSDAVQVTNGPESCAMFLGGGGSFFLRDSAQKVRVLARYLPQELQRLRKDCKKFENAAVLASIGKGAALLTMFHPYYGSGDIDLDVYEKMFPDCGTNWRVVKGNLGSLDERMRFVLHSLIAPLEEGVMKA